VLFNQSQKPYIVYFILITNTLLFSSTELFGGSTNSSVLVNFGALYSLYVSEGQYWRLLTAMFLHAGFFHFALNSLSILIMGSLAESILGHKKFLFIYIFSGITASIISLTFLPSYAVAIGASGAIFGTLAAIGVYYFFYRKQLGEFGKQNFNAILILAFVNLAFGFMGSGVDNWGHIGGLIGGIISGVLVIPKYTRK
tara:strand:+ start:769 stop:1362 length:594 start_codon:yes stop_codon:yes gene_type:complete